MKRKINKVFKALSKKGMTRAFIETEKKEFVYPAISLNYKQHRGKIFLFLIIPAAVLLVVTGFMLINPDKKTDPHQPDSSPPPGQSKLIDGIPTLHHAVIQGDNHSVRRLAEQGENIDAPDAYGWTALHWAAFREDEPMCRALIELHASTSIRSSRRWFKYPAGITAADIAGINKNTSIKALLDNHTGNRTNAEDYENINNRKK